GGFADADVLEELHARTGVPRVPWRLSSLRRPNIGLTIRTITVRPDVSRSSNRNLTKPTLGRLREARVSSTVARAVTRSPGRTGASHLTSSTPGAPMKLASCSK